MYFNLNPFIAIDSFCWVWLFLIHIFSLLVFWFSRVCWVWLLLIHIYSLSPVFLVFVEFDFSITVGYYFDFKIIVHLICLISFRISVNFFKYIFNKQSKSKIIEKNWNSRQNYSSRWCFAIAWTSLVRAISKHTFT